MGKYRIMVVDDDEDARKMIGMVLRPRYEVVEAKDGLDALSKLELYEPDFAIVDLMMPLMDGYQVCEAIRRNPRFNTMQVLFLSAYANTENIKKGYAVGANLFLTKPVDPERVLKNINFTIEHEPPALRPKRHTIEQIAEMESGPHKETPTGHDGHECPVREAREWNPRAESHLDEQPEPAGRTVPPGNRPHAAGPRPRVLMVDDDSELLKMLDLALRDEYETTMATNGIEAIEHMVDYQPDLLLLDIMMPRMNGYQLLQSVRRNSYFALLPVIVLSAKGSPRDKEYALRLGANHFLSKPFHMEDLMTLLDGIVHAPGFRIQNKRVSIQEIRARNAAARNKMI